MPDEFTNRIDDMNTTERTLQVVLGHSAARRAGAIARANGWPPPTEPQGREIGRLLASALAELIRGMRQPGVQVPSEEEVSEVVDGIALGAIEKVMGPPPALAPESATN